MRFLRFSEGSVWDRYDDTGMVAAPREQNRPGLDHFAALCRGFFILMALGLPVALTLGGIAPPTDEPEATIVHGFEARPATADKPMSQAILPRARHAG